MCYPSSHRPLRPQISTRQYGQFVQQVQSFYADAGDSGGSFIGEGNASDERGGGGQLPASSQGLISNLVFPSTAEGLRARLRWHATKFSMKRLLEEGVMLQQEINGLAPLLPGHV